MIQFVVYFILPLVTVGTRVIMKEEKMDEKIINGLTIFLTSLTVLEIILINTLVV